jgi:aspartyl protease family protein
MQKLFLTTIAIGAFVGWAMPSGKPARAPAPAAAAAAAPAPKAIFASAVASGPTILERSPSGHFFVDAEVNNDLVHFVVDTGATMVALTVDDARRLGIPFSESDFTVVGRGASGDARGMPIVLDRISVGGKEVRQVPAAIIQDLDVSLLGQTYLTRLASVQMTGDQMRLD